MPRKILGKLQTTPPGVLSPAGRGLFLLWLACFYGLWLLLVAVGGHGQDLRDHVGIAVSMFFGSFVAGSTPMGGGTVGFPILVLAFGEPAALGRDFSFAVQSVGMTSASVFILVRRQHLEWVILRWSLLGSLLGTPLGVLWLAPHIPELWIKMLFAVVWASFGVLHFRRLRGICSNIGETPAAHRFDRRVGFWVGFLGGTTVASVTGVGIDMVLYSVMVLMMRADLKSAIPSSIILMAFTSMVGALTKSLGPGWMPGVYENWLAAAPIVALGAPLGAVVIHRIRRQYILIFVAALCLGQFGWTLSNEFGRLGWAGAGLALAAVALFNVGFEWLWRVGDRLKRRSP